MAYYTNRQDYAARVADSVHELVWTAPTKALENDILELEKRIRKITVKEADDYEATVIAHMIVHPYDSHDTVSIFECLRKATEIWFHNRNRAK